MSNKFLNSGSTNLTDGTASIFASRLGATSLKAGFPVKVNSNQFLVGEKLSVSDTLNLQSELDGKISNPLTQDLDFQTFSAINVNDVEFNKLASTTPSTANTIKLYANVDGEIHKVDELGNDTVVGASFETLQEVYDASPAPQIVTTVTNDTLVLQQGVGVPTAVLDVQNNTGATLLKIENGTVSMPTNFVRQQPLTGQAFQSISAPGAGFSTLGVGQFSNTATTCSLQAQQTSVTINGGTSSDLFLISGTDEYKFENLASNDKLILEKNDVPRVSYETTETAFGPDGFVVLKDSGEVECKDALVKSFNPTIQFEGAGPTSQSLINMGTPANTQNAFIQLYSNTVSAIDLSSEKRTFLRWGNQNVPIDEFCIERDFNIGVGDVEFIFRPFGGATKRIPITIPISGDEVKINKLNINDEYTLPDVDGNAGQILITNGSGVVNWITPIFPASETLQETYDASISPQIVTTGLNPTLSIKAGVSSPPLVVADQLSNPLMVVQTTGQVVLPRLNDTTQNSMNWLTQNNPSNSWELGNVVSSTDFSIRNGSGSDILKLSQSGEVRINDSYDMPTVAGTSGQYLQTDGSGVAQWANIPTPAQFVQTATTSATNSTTLTELTSTGLGTRTIPANTLVVGSSYRICFRGLCQTQGAGEFIDFFLRVNSGSATSVIGQLNVDFTSVGALNPYDAEFNFTVRSLGVNGSCLTSGQFNYLDNNSLEGDKSNGLSTQLDTTSDQEIELFGLWTALGASNVLIMNQFTIERISGSTTGSSIFSSPVSSVDVLGLQTARDEFLSMKQAMQESILKVQALTGN